MDFALFCEIPMPEVPTKGNYRAAIERAVDEAVLADAVGFHSFWTVEHHFTGELSTCSAPEVVLTHVAARTTNLRIGHGVRLLPHAYNNPIRVAEQAAMLDILSGGRLEFGTGRSATRIELEGFGLDPHATRRMQDEALDTIVGAWTSDEFEFDGAYWKMPPRRVCPQPLQDPHPPLWQATNSPDGHETVGERGLGLLSFTIGVGPEVLAERIASYHKGLSRCTNPIGKYVNDRVGAFTMVHCAPTTAQARAEAKPSFEWYVRNNGRLIDDFAAWMNQGGESFGTYGYVKEIAEATEGPTGERANIDILSGRGAVLAGDPDHIVELAKQYEAAGCQLLMCLLNPFDIGHAEVMRSIELIGTHVIPEFQREDWSNRAVRVPEAVAP